ncbi:253_t:CDS:2 [Dentiscutata erythropus]|uniref:253_t:CDS:1 n=1 Tax=Dentiscutata erythropus TaxID=1348616 RepID=A0A9N9GZN4_9GLOM|nr:253_t:CDS:2 [Dentiscutata erythropus]
MQRYQANISAVMSVVIELAQANYKGEIIAYIPDELIVSEANDPELLEASYNEKTGETRENNTDGQDEYT